MAAVTDLAALTYDNLNLRGLVIDGQIRENGLQLQLAQAHQQILQANRRQVARELTAHLVAMRADVDAGESDTYDPASKTFKAKETVK